ncbi:hypothetical protein [Kitasatospora sp. NPDC097691]|uniref:hypothetical protein n=1 Tax=Kitasatospora sp. NPDC097691 TaxID=3157231 RepID=UPI00332A216A
MLGGIATRTGRPGPRDIARRIVRHRDELGMNEGTLADRAAMSPACLRRLLRSGPEFDPLGFDRVAAVLGLTRADLLSARHPDTPTPRGHVPTPNPAPVPPADRAAVPGADTALRRRTGSPFRRGGARREGCGTQPVIAFTAAVIVAAIPEVPL